MVQACRRKVAETAYCECPNFCGVPIFVGFMNSDTGIFCMNNKGQYNDHEFLAP